MTGLMYCLAMNAAASGLEDILDWLKCNGLCTNPDKTEVMIFKNKHSHHFGAPITHIAIHNPFARMHVVKVSLTLCYLGVFLHHYLNWETHITTMECCACSTIRTVGILGNSVHGLDFINWGKVYHALILPILTYTLPVWFINSGQISLLKHLQVAQNDAVRKMSGSFKTTPMVPLHYLMAIPPIHFTLTKLWAAFNDRLSRLLPSHLLYTIPFSNPTACWPAFVCPLTSLTCLPFFSSSLSNEIATVT